MKHEPITESEAYLITHEVVNVALDKHKREFWEEFPAKIKPVLFEATETVSHRLIDMMGTLHGADLTCKSEMSEVQENLRWAKNKRISEENNRRNFWNGMFTYGGRCVAALVIVFLGSLGLLKITDTVPPAIAKEAE